MMHIPQPLCRVFARDMAVTADIGVHRHEIGHPQTILVSVEIEVVVPELDDVDSTIDYKLFARLANALGRERIGLIETFAYRLAKAVLHHTFANSVYIFIEKPRALESGMAGTSLSLSRSDLTSQL